MTLITAAMPTSSLLGPSYDGLAAHVQSASPSQKAPRWRTNVLTAYGLHDVTNMISWLDDGQPCSKTRQRWKIYSWWTSPMDSS